MRQEFIEWLNLCWNDFYEVWSPEDCDQHIVKCTPYTDVDKFITLINRLYGCHAQDCPWGVVKSDNMKDNKFLIFLNGKSIEIRPFDDDIYNVDLVKEEG